jgi:hypothetical protein
MKIAYFDSLFTRDIQKNYTDHSREAMENSAFSKIFEVRNTNEYTTNITSTESMKRPTWLTESQEPVTNRLEKGFKVTLVAQKFGQKLVISEHAREKAKDNMEKLAEHIATEMETATIGTYDFMEQEAHRVLNFATTSTYYVSPDGQPMISANHLWNSTGATWSNLMASAPLTASVVDAAAAYGGAFVDAEDKPLPLNFDTIVVKKGGAASRAAKKLFGIGTSNQYMATTIGGVNIYFGEMTIIETPYLTNGNAYFFLDMSGKYGNPFLFDIVKAPTVADIIAESNGDYVYPYSAFIKIGIQKQPFTVLYNAGV